MDPATGKLNTKYMRTYTGGDVTFTAFDGKIVLTLRILWKKWKKTLGQWTGIKKVWPFGNSYFADCVDATAGSTTNPALTSSDTTTPDYEGGVVCYVATCESLAKTCGTWSDGCGGTLTCGTACASGGGGGGGGGGPIVMK